MSAIKLSTPSSGSISLSPADTASNLTLTVPAQSGSVVTADSSGNVGIGTSTPTDSNGYGRALDIRGSTTGNGAALYLRNSDASVTGFVSAFGDGRMEVGTATAHPLRFVSNNSERMRLDDSGNLLISRTTPHNFGSGNSQGIDLNASSYIAVSTSGAAAGFFKRYTSTGSIIDFYYSTSAVGSISTNGSNTSYNTSSDYRLKENIAPMTGALAKVSALKPCTYTWKSNGEQGEGFIAHELAQVVPDAVTGEKDAVDAEGNPQYQGIDVSFLVATLTAAIQEQQAMITQLQADVATLKGQA